MQSNKYEIIKNYSLVLSLYIDFMQIAQGFTRMIFSPMFFVLFCIFQFVLPLVLR